MKSVRTIALAFALAISCSGGDDAEPSARVDAALKTAAGAEELHTTLHGTYTGSVDELAATADAPFPEGVELQVMLEGDTSYCIQASDDDSGVWHLTRELPVVADGGC
ncbi:MAG: hypothetical protein ACRDJI_04565 [Actinomycetota bacterium]